MTENLAADLPGSIPQFTKGDRMSKALDHAHISRQEMADYMDVSTETLRRWCNDVAPVKKSTLRLWALATGVDLEWLETGECAIRDSNPEPAALKETPSDLRVLTLAWSVKPGLTPKLRSHRPGTRHLSAVS